MMQLEGIRGRSARETFFDRVAREPSQLEVERAGGSSSGLGAARVTDGGR